ncbi:MAG: hypothetical protein EBZ49_05085 [Proteobacteria bacterium]|nr:hypothetical protein [Pseudomonadota bacterium]
MPKKKTQEISSHLKKRLDGYGLTLPLKEHKIVKLDLDEPHQKYFLKCGTEVDGTTRALKYIPKDALIGWAYKLGKQGKDMNAEKGNAAKIGTIAHFLIQCDLMGWEPDLSACDGILVQSAQIAFKAYREWFSKAGLRPLAVEAQLVSHCYRFGGTIDLIGIDQHEELTLVDFKTSGGLWQDYLFQVSAYANLWEENFRRLPIQRLLLVRLDKETGEHETKSLTEWRRHWEVYVALLRLAKRVKDISAK